MPQTGDTTMEQTTTPSRKQTCQRNLLQMVVAGSPPCLSTTALQPFANQEFQIQIKIQSATAPTISNKTARSRGMVVPFLNTILKPCTIVLSRVSSFHVTLAHIYGKREAQFHTSVCHTSNSVRATETTTPQSALTGCSVDHHGKVQTSK